MLLCLHCTVRFSGAADWAGGGGNWNTVWDGVAGHSGWIGSVPNGSGTVANFNASYPPNTGGLGTVVNVPVKIGTFSFSGGNTDNNRTISPSGGLTFDEDGSGPGNALISNTNSSATDHNWMRIYNPGVVTLADDLLISNTGLSTNTTGAIQIQNVLRGTGNVTFSNSTTTLSPTGSIRMLGFANTFSGPVLVQKGTTTFDTAAAFASNTITLGQKGQGSAALLAVNKIVSTSPVLNNIVVASGGGGTLTLGSSGATTDVTYGGTITLDGDLAVMSETTATGVTLSNNIAGPGGLTKDGTGKVTLSHSNTFFGDTNLRPNSGELVLNNADALSLSTLDYTGSTLTFSSLVTSRLFQFGGLAGSANIALLDNAASPHAVALNVGANNASTTYSGVLSGAGSSIVKVGVGTLTLSSATGNSYTGGTSVNTGALLVTNTSGSGTGSGIVTVSGTLGGSGFVGVGGASVTVNAGGTVRGGTGAIPSGTFSVNGNLTFNSGSIVELALGPGGTHSILARPMGTWSFDSGQTFTFIDLGAQTTFYDNIITGLAGDPGVAGWTIKNPGWVGFFAYDGGAGAGNVDLTLTKLPASLVNISTRAMVLTGNNVLIGGFIIKARGTPGTKQVVIRAIGPSLANVNPPVLGGLADTILELHMPDGSTITNDNWHDNAAGDLATITANHLDVFNGQSISDFESAIVATLPSVDLSFPGSGLYTAIVSGTIDPATQLPRTGLALVEVYDLDDPATAVTCLVNISTRAFVDMGNNVLIGGFIVQPAGMSNAMVLIRAIGPSLTAWGIQGTLADPLLELYDKNGQLITTNDDWGTNLNNQEIIDTGIAPNQPMESALLLSLAPDAYTAIVKGKGNSTGVGSVEVYQLDK